MAQQNPRQNPQQNNFINEKPDFGYLTEEEFNNLLAEGFHNYNHYPIQDNTKVYTKHENFYDTITAVMNQNDEDENKDEDKDEDEYKITIVLKSKQYSTLEFMKFDIPIFTLFFIYQFFDVSTKKIIDGSKLPWLNNCNVKKYSSLRNDIQLIITPTGLRIEEILDTCISWFEIPWENIFKETTQKLTEFFNNKIQK